MNAPAAAYTEAVVYQTCRTPLRIHAQEHRAFEPLEQPDENTPTIMVDVDRTFQTIEGFGGAFTDAHRGQLRQALARGAGGVPRRVLRPGRGQRLYALPDDDPLLRLRRGDVHLR